MARNRVRFQEELARRNLDPTSTVVSDDLGCFRGVANAGCTH